MDDLQVSLHQQTPIPLQAEFSCKAGQLLALIGPSGSGKSTTLRAIAGLQSATQQYIRCANSVWADSKNRVNWPTQQRRVGLVFQHYALFPHKSALDNVMLAIHGVSRTERKHRAYHWLERTNMTGLELRKPSALSGGQRQRVALARALAREPAVLLLDEPFSAVDQQTRRILYRELAQLRASLNIPMIMVTHDIHEVQQLADTLCLIHRGTTLQHGDVQQVMNAPKTKEIARLLGHQNLVSATVASHRNEYTVFQLGTDEHILGQRMALEPGQPVTLLIAPSAIALANCSGNASNINCLHGSIRDAVGMGDELSLRIHLDNVTKSLRFRVSLHQDTHSGIKAGDTASITLLPTGIHAIPEQP